MPKNLYTLSHSLFFFLIFGIVGLVVTYTNAGSFAFATSYSQGNIKDTPLSEKGTVINPTKKTALYTIDPSWNPLLERLKKDEPSINYDTYFRGLEPYSSAPMSVKVKELYGILTRPKVQQGNTKRVKIAPSIYKGFVTRETVQKCKEFLVKNKPAFDLMEQRYHVPRSVVVSLLYVETKLGTFLGKEKAFWSLASMAMADSPERTMDGIASLHIKDDHQDWLKTRLKDKSSWAYKELRALLKYSATNGLDPQTIPGSVYGAIGLCQFMPSNIALYGDDGTGNGKVDLFNESDAIVSVGKYFVGHGWKGILTEDKKKKVIKRYNNLDRYANTILALSSAITTGKLPGEAKGKKILSQKKESPQKKKSMQKSQLKGKQAQPNKKRVVKKQTIIKKGS